MGTIYKSGINYSGGGGSGVPTGGTTGQALVKKSNADQDVEWKDVQEKIDAGWNLVKDADGKTLSVHDSVSYNIPDSNGYAVFVRSRPMKQDGTRGFVDLAVDNTPTGSTAVTTRENENTVTKFLQEKIVAGNGLTLAADGKTLHTNFFGQNGIQVSNSDRTIKLTDDIYNKIINNTADYGEYHNRVEKVVGKINYDGTERTVYQMDLSLFNPGDTLKSKGQYFGANTLYEGLFGFSFTASQLSGIDIGIIDTDIVGGGSFSPKPGNAFYSINSSGNANVHQFVLAVYHTYSAGNPPIGQCSVMFGVTNGQAYANVPGEHFQAKTPIYARIRYVKL